MRSLDRLRLLGRRTYHAWADLQRWAYRRKLLPDGAVRLPDFLCIGAQKAGTTWLYENLRRHPGIYLHGRKEIHYWNRRTHRGLLFYSRYFRDAGTRVTGDITPAYAVLSPEEMRSIAEVIPGLRVIYLLRDPVDRAWSHALMYYVKHQGLRYQEVSDEQWRTYFRLWGCRGRGTYVRTIGRWASAFPPGQVAVGFYDDIGSRPEAFLTRVFRFLGVAEEVDWGDFPLRERINPGQRFPLPERLRDDLRGVYAEELDHLHHWFGERVAGWNLPPDGWAPEKEGAARPALPPGLHLL